MRKPVNLNKLKSEFDAVSVRHVQNIDGRGGFSLASIVDGSERFLAIAKCHDSDQFNRRLGRQIAVGRALLLRDMSKRRVPVRNRLKNNAIATAIEVPIAEACKELGVIVGDESNLELP